MYKADLEDEQQFLARGKDWGCMRRILTNPFSDANKLDWRLDKTFRSPPLLVSTAAVCHTKLRTRSRSARPGQQAAIRRSRK